MSTGEEAYRPTDKRVKAEGDYIVAEDVDTAVEVGRQVVDNGVVDTDQTVADGGAAYNETGRVDSAESEIQRLSRERDEYLDLARRTQADYENYRKRVMRQQVEESTRQVQDLVVKLLPVLDAFSIAEMHIGAGADMDPDTKALLQSGNMLFDVLASVGVERIDQVGVPFDPTVHEAIEHHVRARHAKEPHVQARHAKEPHEKAHNVAAKAYQDGESQEEVPDDQGQSHQGQLHDGGAVVTGVLRAGYRWGGKVLRPAMVKVEE